VNDRDVTDVLELLVGNVEDEIDDWDDVVERAAAPVRTRPSSRPRRQYLLGGAAVAVAVVVALVVAEPWRGGPSILDRAAAAILTPNAQQILYERIAVYPSGFVHVPRPPAVRIEVEAWVDGARPGTFRIRGESSPPSEFGGRIGSIDALAYSFANGTLYPSPFSAPITRAILDPAQYIKASLTSGKAKADGTTTIRGRPVVRIRILSHPYSRTVIGALFFVDAHTYRPVRIELNASLPFSSKLGYPLTCLTYGFQSGCATYGTEPDAKWVYDFTDYRFLPRTAANRRLTNIRAMHPKAEIL